MNIMPLPTARREIEITRPIKVTEISAMFKASHVLDIIREKHPEIPANATITLYGQDDERSRLVIDERAVIKWHEEIK